MNDISMFIFGLALGVGSMGLLINLVTINKLEPREVNGLALYYGDGVYYECQPYKSVDER